MTELIVSPCKKNAMSQPPYTQSNFRGICFPSREKHFFAWLDAGNNYQSHIPVAAAIFSLMRPGIVLDVGANVGLLSKIFSCLFDEVYAFEPSAENRACIYKNLPENDCNVVVYPYALGDAEGQKLLYKCKANCGGDTLLKPSDFDISDSVFSADSVMVNVRTLDSFDFQSPISCIKLDVQGWESFVLRGALKTLNRHKPVVICEIKSENIDNSKEIQSLLLSCGYRTATPLSPLDRLYIHEEDPLSNKKQIRRQALRYMARYAKSTLKTAYTTKQIREYCEVSVKSLKDCL
tara:strand:+ start:179 stop:1054 length:876 start_codon:yes stop_codon:yes gene_type:complete